MQECARRSVRDAMAREHASSDDMSAQARGATYFDDGSRARYSAAARERSPRHSTTIAFTARLITAHCHHRRSSIDITISRSLDHYQYTTASPCLR